MKEQRKEKRRQVELIKKKKEIKYSDEEDAPESDESTTGEGGNNIKKGKNNFRNWIILVTVILWFIGFWMIGSMILDSSFYMFPENLFAFLQERTIEQFPLPLGVFTIIALVVLIVLLVIIFNFGKIRGYVRNRNIQNN